MPQLHVRSGDSETRVVELGDRPVTVGRADDNDVVLAEPKASRRHCTFRPVGSGWRVVDEGSSNGTWLGDRPVLSARLQPGDEVEIGGTVISYRGQASAPAAAPVLRRRRSRAHRPPWEALVASAVLVAIAWFVSGSLAEQQTTRETEAWKRVAGAGIARADLAPTPDARRTELEALARELSTHPLAGDAVTMVRGATGQTRPAADDAPRPPWMDSFERIEAARARMSPTERRVKLRELLSRFAGDPGAVEAVAGALKTDEADARSRDADAAERFLADADAAVADGRLGDAFADWVAWFDTAPEIPREAEQAVAAKMQAAAKQAENDAGVVAAQYEEHLKEGRIAAAEAAATAAVERLRGTGWDVWLAARVHRFGGAGSPAPTAGGPVESETARAQRLAKERLDRAMRASDSLARQRRFTDAAVTLGEAAEKETDETLRADLRARVEDLSAEAAVLGVVLGRVREDAARFGAVPQPGGGAAKLAGAEDDALLYASAQGGGHRRVGVGEIPSAAFPVLLDKAGLEPASYLGAALLVREIGEQAAYARWMRAALSDESLRMEASAVHARLQGAETPVGGYFAHPGDPTAIVTAEQRKAIENAGKIAEKTAELEKVLAKIDESKQAKQVHSVAAAYAKLEAARNHALELIFDEVKYFYPYRNRMKEYAPVQREVDERVEKVREAWEDRTSAKVRPDAALTKLVAQAEDLMTEIEFYGGDPTAARERVERLQSYLGTDLTVRTFFVTELDRKLLEANDAMMASNAKVKGDIADAEREQVRITNEYRILMGHRRVLRIHEKLVASSRGHSEDMSKLGFFDHESPVPGKKSPWDRMNLAGYPNTPCSENISAGRGDPQGAHDGWCHSSGHHRNLLWPNWSEMGSGQAGRYWTQNFGYAEGDDAVGGTGPR